MVCEINSLIRKKKELFFPPKSISILKDYWWTKVIFSLLRSCLLFPPADVNQKQLTEKLTQAWIFGKKYFKIKPEKNNFNRCQFKWTQTCTNWNPCPATCQLVQWKVYHSCEGKEYKCHSLRQWQDNMFIF